MLATESPYLTSEEVALRERLSLRSVRELTRTGRIPHIRRPGSRRVLFRLEELELWEVGAELEVLELPNGGRLVRPREDT